MTFRSWPTGFEIADASCEGGRINYYNYDEGVAAWDNISPRFAVTVRQTGE